MKFKLLFSVKNKDVNCTMLYNKNRTKNLLIDVRLFKSLKFCILKMEEL